jgi:hypothetical protein
MQLTKPHFELIADTIAELPERERLSVAHVFARKLATMNAFFKRDLFIGRAQHGARRYSVVENTPGYMPDSDPATFHTRSEATAYAVSLVNEYREDSMSRVTGSAKEGSWQIEDLAAISDLGRVIEVVDLYALYV